MQLKWLLTTLWNAQPHTSAPGRSVRYEHSPRARDRIDPDSLGGLIS